MREQSSRRSSGAAIHGRENDHHGHWPSVPVEEPGEWWSEEVPFARLTTAVASTAVDQVEHDDDEFVATVDPIGFDRNEVEVSVADSRLRTEAEHEEATEENYLRRERRESSLRRSIRLPAEVDAAAVEAKMRNGVLTVTLPKRESEEAQRIEIE